MHADTNCKCHTMYRCDLPAGDMLNDLLNVVPELNEFANLHLKVAFNKDSSRVGPREWVQLARLLHQNRKDHDAFLVVHGTDTMAYTASALSLMLLGFRKPIVMTGLNAMLLCTYHCVCAGSCHVCALLVGCLCYHSSIVHVCFGCYPNLSTSPPSSRTWTESCQQYQLLLLSALITSPSSTMPCAGSSSILSVVCC